MEMSISTLRDMGIQRAWEDDEYWYVLPVPTDYYDNAMYKVSKDDDAVEFMMYPDFIVDIMDDVVEVEDVNDIF